MVNADAELFAGLGQYFAGMARILRAGLEDNESDGLAEAAGMFQQALEQIKVVREREDRILSVAQPIEYSAFFVRRNEVASGYTEALAQGLEEMTRDLAEGYYPAEACSNLNQVLTRMMANFDQDARIEGVLTRIEQSGPEPTQQSQ